MFQRNIRSIPPYKLQSILLGLYNLTRSQGWNQNTQNQLCKFLETTGLKRNGYQYDPHSGGPRTYASQLENLGFIFWRKDDPRMYLTIAGEQLLKGDSPVRVLQTQILRHQYPSLSSINPMTKLHPEIRVKPFVFILMLLRDNDIQSLSDEELCVPVAYGHNYNCFDLCKEKILKIRSGAMFKDVLISPEDLYTTRAKDRSLSRALADVKDIANTAKNWLEATRLVNLINENGLGRITLNVVYDAEVNAAIAEKDDFIALDKKHAESFQRQYGRFDRSKDHRQRLEDDSITVNPIQEMIVARFLDYSSENIVDDIPHELVDVLTSKIGFDRKLVLETIKSQLSRGLSHFEKEFIDMSKSGGDESVGFEKALCSLFQTRLNFNTKHTGQIKRRGKKGGYSDGFLIALDGTHCGLVEAKASVNYGLPAPDFFTMSGNYIPNYMELCDGKEIRLEFCLYVAGGFKRTIQDNLTKLSAATGVPVSAIDSFDLLNISKKYRKREDQGIVRENFRKAKLLKGEDFDFYNTGSSANEFDVQDKAADT